MGGWIAGKIIAPHSVHICRGIESHKNGDLGKAFKFDPEFSQFLSSPSSRARIELFDLFSQKFLFHFSFFSGVEITSTMASSSQLHHAPPFRAEHMGSLLRPQKLLDVRAQIRDEGISEEAAGLPAIEKESIGKIVKTQLDLGFKAVNSGEYNRTRFWGLFWDELEGTTRLQDADASMFRLYHPDVVSLIEKDRKVMPGDSVIAGSKIRYPANGTKSNLAELKEVQAFVPKEEWGNIKLTVITPAVSFCFFFLGLPRFLT